MSQTDDTTSATKSDIQQINQTLRQIDGRLEQHDAQFELLLRHVNDKADEVMQHFNLVAENMHHDFNGSFHDRLVQHEDRFVRVERRLKRIERRLQLT